MLTFIVLVGEMMGFDLVSKLIERNVLIGIGKQLLQHDRQRGLARAGAAVEKDDVAGLHDE